MSNAAADALHILLLEDELPAARKAKILLQRFAPGAVLSHVRSLAKARTWFAEAHPLHLIVSDIQLLDGSAFELFSTKPPGVPIIFLTAYSGFRANAFDTDGIAYLVKPYSDKEFAAVWAKFERLSVLQHTHDASTKTLTLKSRLADTTTLLPLQSVAYLESQGDFTMAIARAGQRFPLNETLAALEETLDKASYFRLSRSVIVARHAVASYLPFRKNRLAVRLSHPPDTELLSSNRSGPAFKRWLATE